MALIACPKCNSEDINGTPQADSRLLIHCADCGHEWLRGEARRDPGRPAVQTIDSLHAAFPTAADVRLDVRERVAMLSRRVPCSTTAGARPRGRRVPRPLPGAVQPRGPVDGARPRTCWTSPTPTRSPAPATCPASTARGRPRARTRRRHKVRESIEYLLYGPESLRLEDRLTQLIEGKKGSASRRSTRSRCSPRCSASSSPSASCRCSSTPRRSDGKKEIAKLVFELDLPPAEKVAWTIGRLAVWSNDLLRSLVGNDIPDLQHATQFLAWAKTQPALSRT